MKTPKCVRRVGLILMLAGLVAVPMSARACDPVSTLLQWLGLGAPPPAPLEGGPGCGPIGGGC